MNCDNTSNNKLKENTKKVETKGIRRSRRTKKAKDDFSIVVSSDETIREIKIKVNLI
jgi:hypothetical protein